MPSGGSEDSAAQGKNAEGRARGSMGPWAELRRGVFGVSGIRSLLAPDKKSHLNLMELGGLQGCGTSSAAPRRNIEGRLMPKVVQGSPRVRTSSERELGSVHVRWEKSFLTLGVTAEK